MNGGGERSRAQLGSVGCRHRHVQNAFATAERDIVVRVGAGAAQDQEGEPLPQCLPVLKHAGGVAMGVANWPNFWDVRFPRTLLAREPA